MTSCAFLLESGTATGVAGDDPMYLFGREDYILRNEESEEFSKLWRKIEESEQDKPYLRYPLYRFYDAFDNKRVRHITGYRNVIVDYVTILESLIFYKEERTLEPAGKTIGISLGMLIRENQKEYEKIKRTVEKAYSIRNAEVHANLEKLEKYQREHDRIIMDLENYIRRALRKLVEE